MSAMTTAHEDGTISGKCYTCKMFTTWYITHQWVDYMGVTHCLRCERCGRTVPEPLWNRYQLEGREPVPI